VAYITLSSFGVNFFLRSFSGGSDTS